jgi:DNA polymerase III subunit gamma/tau
MIGADWKVETAVDPSAQPGSESAPRVSRSAVQPSGPSEPPPSAPPPWASDEAPPAPPEEFRPAARPESIAAARSNIAPTRNGDEAPPPSGPDPDADAHRDDQVAEDNGVDSTELLQRELGATVIEEIPHE